MKSIITLSIIALTALTATAHSQSDEKNSRKETMRAKLMKKFDTNKDGVLDANEKAELKKYRDAHHAKRGQGRPPKAPAQN